MFPYLWPVLELAVPRASTLGHGWGLWLLGSSLHGTLGHAHSWSCLGSRLSSYWSCIHSGRSHLLLGSWCLTGTGCSRWSWSWSHWCSWHGLEACCNFKQCQLKSILVFFVKIWPFFFQINLLYCKKPKQIKNLL